MMSVVAPVVGLILQWLKSDKAELAQRTGVAPGAVDKITQAMEDYLTRDERFRQQAEAALHNARQHDVQTFDSNNWQINMLRSSVRPLCSFVAMGWYVYARANGIPLAAEDYAIIGGILAFWFGFRPFEKQR